MTDDQRTSDDPFIERPDEHKQGDELYCWMPGSEDRECEGSCVAYDEGYVEDQRRSSCAVLNIVKSAGMSLAIMSNVAKKGAQQQDTRARQEQADSLPKPPEVR